MSPARPPARVPMASRIPSGAVPSGVLPDGVRPGSGLHVGPVRTGAVGTNVVAGRDVPPAPGWDASVLPELGGGRQEGVSTPDWVRTWRPPAGAYGPCPPAGTRLVLVLDESGSVIDADPVRYRRELLDRVVETLDGACSCGRCEVVVVLFGQTGNSTTRRPVTRTWSTAGRHGDPLFTSLPSTGSYLGPANDQVDVLRLGANDVVVGLTDLQLFDVKSGAELDRFARRPSPLILVLGAEDDVSCPVPTLRIAADAAGTAVADAVAAHVTAARPAGRAVGGSTGRFRHRSEPREPRTSGSRRLGCWLLPLLGLALVPLAMLLVSALADDDSSRSTTSPIGPVAAPAQADRAPAALDGTFTIPGLFGDAPRTTPAATTIVVDPALGDSPAVLTQIRKELPAVVEYLRSYGIAGDKLRLGSGTMRPVTAAALSKEAAQIAPSSVSGAATAARISDKDRATQIVVVLTDRPQLWRNRLTSSRAADPGEMRYFVADVGDAAPVPSNLTGHGPWTVPAGDRAAGGIAVPVARAWAKGIEAGWDG